MTTRTRDRVEIEAPADLRDAVRARGISDELLERALAAGVAIDSLWGWLSWRRMDAADLTAARRHFEAGARSAWHSHTRGQLLLVEQGRMRTQKRGQALRELGVGESDYTAADIVHWHGAVPDQPLVQINVGFGGETKWLEKVTDAEYGGR